MLTSLGGIRKRYDKKEQIEKVREDVAISKDSEDVVELNSGSFKPIRSLEPMDQFARVINPDASLRKTRQQNINDALIKNRLDAVNMSHLVLNFNRFLKKADGDDEVSLTLNISANLRSLFTWNTKQVSLWDGIIPSKEDAEFRIHTTNKYRFIDQGSNLQGRGFNLTLHWHVMPKTGKMFADKIIMSDYHLPEAYRI